MRIAPPSPICRSRNVGRALPQKGFAGDRIEGIRKVDFENCLVPVVSVSPHELLNDPDDGLRAERAGDPDLERLEI